MQNQNQHFHLAHSSGNAAEPGSKTGTWLRVAKGNETSSNHKHPMAWWVDCWTALTYQEFIGSRTYEINCVA